MTAPEVKVKHWWAPGLRDGMPVLMCDRVGCRMVWWSDRNEPRAECKGRDDGGESWSAQ